MLNFTVEENWRGMNFEKAVNFGDQFLILHGFKKTIVCSDLVYRIHSLGCNGCISQRLLRKFQYLSYDLQSFVAKIVEVLLLSCHGCTYIVVCNTVAQISMEVYHGLQNCCTKVQ
jgi:hypothetical protein